MIKETVMRQEDKLKDKMGKKLPYTVPEDYFRSFKKDIIQSLPEYPEKPQIKNPSFWHRVKPYVYLAAMFAGIWCMMQIFHRVSVAENKSNIETTVLANYEPDSYDLYLDDSAGQDLELQDEIQSLYPNLDDFKRDFYAQL